MGSGNKLEANKGPLELRRKKGRTHVPGGRPERLGWASDREHARKGAGGVGESHCWASVLRGFICALKAEI